MRQRRQANGRPHVVRKVEEGGTVRDEARRVHSDAVADGCHGMLTHSEPQVTALVLYRGKL